MVAVLTSEISLNNVVNIKCYIEHSHIIVMHYLSTQSHLWLEIINFLILFHKKGQL